MRCNATQQVINVENILFPFLLNVLLLVLKTDHKTYFPAEISVITDRIVLAKYLRPPMNFTTLEERAYRSQIIKEKNFFECVCSVC